MFAPSSASGAPALGLGDALSCWLVFLGEAQPVLTLTTLKIAKTGAMGRWKGSLCLTLWIVKQIYSRVESLPPSHSRTGVSANPECHFTEG